MSPRRTMRAASWVGRAAASASVLALVLGLVACGVRSAPRQPEGSTYPRQYPAPEDGKTMPADKAKESGVSPSGSPHDVPNRPASR